MWAAVIEVLPGPAWFGTTAKLGYIVTVRLLETVLGNVFIWAGSTDLRASTTTAPRSTGSRRSRPGPGGDGDDDRGLARHPRRDRVAVPALGRGERAAPAADRAGRATRGTASAAVRYGQGRGTDSADAEPRHRLAALHRLHHLDIVVSSIERSLPFYRELLGPLGWHGHGEVEGERGETIHYLTGPGARSACARRRRRPRAPTTATASACTTSRSRSAPAAAVDERAEWLRAHGAEIESGPQAYWYQPGYYAVFFYDPDGLKLELVHVPAHAA